MNTPRKPLCFLLALVLLLMMTAAVYAAEPEDTDSCIGQMLNYCLYHPTTSGTDIQRLCQELEQSDPALAQTWENITGYLAWANSKMTVNPDVLPDGLPDDDSLCIVVLGYALKSNGSMRDELVGRLEAALASAEKYPNAYILCTGGGTASRSKTKTEAGQMAKWLKNQGIAQERIIIEDESLSTIQNAQYSCRILAAEYPQVKHIALVSSDYHVPQGCVYFNTQLALSAYKSGTEPLDVVGNACYQTTNRDAFSLSTLVSGIAQLAGIDYSSAKPSLSRLTHLEIDGAFTYETGTAMTLTATAHYNTGFSKDVTSAAVFSGVDMNQSGEQLLTVTYTENGIEATARLLIDVVSNSIEDAGEELVEIANTEAAPEPVTPATGTPAPLAPFLLLAVLLALLALLIRLKIMSNKRK